MLILWFDDNQDSDEYHLIGEDIFWYLKCHNSDEMRNMTMADFYKADVVDGVMWNDDDEDGDVNEYEDDGDGDDDKHPHLG